MNVLRKPALGGLLARARAALYDHHHYHSFSRTPDHIQRTGYQGHSLSMLTKQVPLRSREYYTGRDQWSEGCLHAPHAERYCTAYSTMALTTLARKARFRYSSQKPENLSCDRDDATLRGAVSHTTATRQNVSTLQEM